MVLKRYSFIASIETMDNEEATISNIRAQLHAYGWVRVEETIDNDKQFEPENTCYLELYKEDGTRLGWGMFPRLYCWTETYTHITGRSWTTAIMSNDLPAP